MLAYTQMDIKSVQQHDNGSTVVCTLNQYIYMEHLLHKSCILNVAHTLITRTQCFNVQQQQQQFPMHWKLDKC